MEVELQPATLIECLRRGFRVGIPPTALAAMFDIPVEVVQNFAIHVRRGQYGSAELSEVLVILTWKANEKIWHILEHGSPADSLKAASFLTGKALATAVRQTPEEVARIRQDLLAMIQQERLLELEGEEVEDETSSFVAVDEELDDQGQGLQAHPARS